MDIKIIKSFFIVNISLILFQMINSKIDLTENKIGYLDDYFYELWKSDNIGITTMSIDNKNKFSCSWKNIDNVVFNLGKNFPNGYPLKNISDITLHFDFEYESNGYSYIGINGCFSIYSGEYYIIENYGDSFSKPNSGSLLGTLSIDDGEYDIYLREVILPPNIHGISKRSEYWSVRKEKRSSGTISLKKHFDSFLKKGAIIENVFTIGLFIEGYQSNGNADVNNFEIIINGE